MKQGLETQDHGNPAAISGALSEFVERQQENDYLQARLPLEVGRIRHALRLTLVVIALSAGLDFTLLADQGEALRLLMWRLCAVGAGAVALSVLRGDVTRNRAERTFLALWLLVSAGVSLLVWRYAEYGAHVVYAQPYALAIGASMLVTRLRVGIAAAALGYGVALITTSLHPEADVRTQFIAVLLACAVAWLLIYLVVLKFERARRLSFAARATMLRKISELESVNRSLREQLVYNQKAGALGVMTAGLVHDFNNMLTVIRANALVVKDALASHHHSVDAQEGTDDILLAVEHATGITSKLMAFNRPDRSTPESFVFDAFVEDSALLLRRLIPKHVEFTVSKGAGKTRVVLDKTHLEQILSNLLLNSMEAISGPGRIAVATSYDPGRSEVVLSVEDNGGGISEDLRSRVFEPFFTTKQRGSGLGLSTIKFVVEEAGGQIALDGVKGGGTRVTIHLPLVAGVEERSCIRASSEAHVERVSEVTSSRPERTGYGN